jgi:hypothetical protein
MWVLFMIACNGVSCCVADGYKGARLHQQYHGASVVGMTRVVLFENGWPRLVRDIVKVSGYCEFSAYVAECFQDSYRTINEPGTQSTRGLWSYGAGNVQRLSASQEYSRTGKPP